MPEQYAVLSIEALAGGALVNFRSTPLPFAGRIRRIVVKANANVTGNATFDLNINGESIFADASDRPTVVAGETEVVLSGLSVPHAENDILSVDADSIPLGGLTNVAVVVVSDDMRADSPAPVEFFVRALYLGALEREPDEEDELQPALEDLTAACFGFSFITAARTLATDVFTSGEFTALSLTNAEFVGRLYAAYLNRDADADPTGRDFWIAALVGGETRANVRTAFANSPEFVNRTTIFCRSQIPVADATTIQGQEPAEFVRDAIATALSDSSDLDFSADDPGNTLTATVKPDAVTNAKLADMPTARFKGRSTAGTGDPEDLTAAQAAALLPTMTGDAGSGGAKGLVPAPATGDAAKFLKGDGSWATPSGGGGGVAVDVQVFTADGTWTKPAGVTVVQVICIGGGGGGGGGRGGAAASTRCGGAGGGGGARSEMFFRASLLGATEAVVVGDGGAGGAGGSSANGVAGGNGEASTFGSSMCFAGGGGGGAAGSTGTSSTSGSGGGTSSSAALNVPGWPVVVNQTNVSGGAGAGGNAGNAEWGGGAAGNGSNSTGSGGGTSLHGGAGGAGAGGVTTGNAAALGGNGGNAGALGLTGGGAGGGVGGNGADASAGRSGSGGGGGGGNSAGTGGAGGNGGIGGGGAGGGGGGLTTGGAGGNGGRGEVRVYSW